MKHGFPFARFSNPIFKNPLIRTSAVALSPLMSGN
jgi:hypothetical protein